jgi:prefoldin beta subunit
MALTKEAQEQFRKLQVFEQNIQAIEQQKQQLQSQQMEAESALTELKKSDVAYKMIGGLMVKADKEELLNDIEQKQEIIAIRLKSVEKQEEQTKKRIEELQKDLLSNMEEKK